MRRTAIYLLFYLVLINANGQTTDDRPKYNYSANLDLYSSHLWRGIKNGSSYSIQPTVAITMNQVTFGSWAAYAGNGSYFELDLFAEYTYRRFTFSLYDYFCPSTLSGADFFEFKKYHTKHTLDAMILWSPERIPFRVMASTLVWGDDLSKTSGNQSYSTYIEPAFTWRHKRFSGDLFVGITPYKGYYASDPSLVNAGTAFRYNLKVGDFEVPIQSKVCYNPIQKSTWYSFGVTLSVKN